jgi:hypothetical protein
MSNEIYSKLKLLEEEISLLNSKLSTDKQYVFGKHKINASKVKALEVKINKLISQLELEDAV